MTDRADEIAREIVSTATTKAAEGVCILGHDRSALIDGVAAALRSYADERLEAAARLVDNCPPYEEVGSRVRSLKSPQPETKA